jgi:hypothetical protein
VTFTPFYYRVRSVAFRFQCLDIGMIFRINNRLKDLILIRISVLYILDVRCRTLHITYTTRYCATQLADIVNSLRDIILDNVDFRLFFSDHLNYNMVKRKRGCAPLLEWYKRQNIVLRLRHLECNKGCRGQYTEMEWLQNQSHRLIFNLCGV